MDTPARHPLERAADGAIAKAVLMGGYAAAHWNHDTEDWSVHSATDPHTVYRVWRKHPDGPTTEQSERQRQANRGWWWFTLECNCPAITQSGYAVCKHKAAVRLWQEHYQRRDGRAWGTLPEHSNRSAHANTQRDPDGVETWKDKEGRIREPDIYCNCPEDPCLEPWCPCNWCEEHYAAPLAMERGVFGGPRPQPPDDLPW